MRTSPRQDHAPVSHACAMQMLLCGALRQLYLTCRRRLRAAARPRRARTRNAACWGGRRWFQCSCVVGGWACTCGQTRPQCCCACGGGPADCRLQRRPAAVGPLQGASGEPVRMRGSSLHEQHTEQCGRTAATKDLPAEFLGSGTSLLGAQWGVTRKGDGSCYMHAEFCPSRTSAPGGMRSPASHPGQLHDPRW